MPATAKSRTRFLILTAYWLFLFTATHIPARHVPRVGRGHVDKVVHFGLYVGLAVLVGRYLAVTEPSKFRFKALLWASVFVAYAAFDEWLQQYTHRLMDFWDWVADVCGVAVGTSFSCFWYRKPVQNEPC